MKQEMIFALKENNCAFELNFYPLFKNERLPERFKRGYMEYAAQMQEMGVTLSIGSDCHEPHITLVDYETAERELTAAGIDLSKNMFKPKHR